MLFNSLWHYLELKEEAGTPNPPFSEEVGATESSELPALSGTAALARSHRPVLAPYVLGHHPGSPQRVAASGRVCFLPGHVSYLRGRICLCTGPGEGVNAAVVGSSAPLPGMDIPHLP